MAVFGIIVGIAFAIGLACFITSIVLLKSNNIGDSTGSLQQYAGYDPIIAECEGQVSSSDGNYGLRW